MEGGARRQERVQAATRRQGKRWAVIPPGGQSAWLAALPVAALRIPEETVSLLGELGVQAIGQLLELPRTSVASRLGPLVARRLAEFEGSRGEPLQAVADEAFRMRSATSLLQRTHLRRCGVCSSRSSSSASPCCMLEALA